MAEETPDNSLDDPRLEDEEDVNHTLPVLNGFQLKQKSQTLPFKTLTYAPAVVYNNNTPPTVVDWQLLTLYHVEGNHIRIHELKEGEDLCAAIDEYKSAYAKAVVVINTEESLVLSKEIVRSLKNIGNYLVAVLSHSDGDNLLDCLEVHFEDVFARLEIVSSEATLLAVLGEDEETAVLEMDRNSSPVKSDSHATKAFSGLTKYFTNHPVFDLKTEIKRVLFQQNIMSPVSDDAGLFTIVMSNFSQYEKVGKSDSNYTNELLKLFSPYIEPTFHVEFPFFLVLAYRLRRFRPLYECDQSRGFITKCIDTFELLPPQQVVETLEKFIQNKDFDIMFDSDIANTSVFQLLATACHEFMALSTKIKNSHPGSSTTKRFFYCRILWISIYLKCLIEKGITTRIEADIWDNDLLKSDVSRKTVINRETIDDLKLGLELSTMLQLPTELQFTTHHLSRLLADEKFIRPFSHIRDVLVSLEGFIQSDSELLVHVMVNLRGHFTPFLQSRDQIYIGKASAEGTVLGVIDEGISFLDGMMDLWVRKGWDKSPQHKYFKDELFKWINLLLDTICVTEVTLTKMFLFPKRRSVIADENVRKHIKKQILEKTRNIFPDLSIQMFFPLYVNIRIWPTAFVHDYLKQYHIPCGIKISDAIWTEFFTAVLERFQNEEPQTHLLEFLKSVAESYRSNKRAGDFIPDVLRLNVPLLFAAENEPGAGDGSLVGDMFSSFLREYIQRNNLHPVIMNKIQDIIGYIADKKQHAFHWIVLNVLQLEVIQVLKASQWTEKNMSQHLKDILVLSVDALCQNISWFASLSPIQRFYWGVVATGCEKVTITETNLEWVHHFQYLVTQLSRIFNTYCNSRKLHDHQCLLMPEEVDECPWVDVQKYFHWVGRVQHFLSVHHNKFEHSNVNWDEICDYDNHIADIAVLGQALHANSYVEEIQHILEMKNSFSSCFELLHVCLLRYVPNHPEVKYCTLPELLNRYGVSLIPELQEAMSRKISFPGDHKVLVEQCIHNVLPPSVRKFEPGQDISLILTKSFSLNELQTLLDKIYQFLEPVKNLMNMFVFFYLHGSELFDKHLLKHLQHLTATSPPKKAEKRSPSVMLAMPSKKHDSSSVSVQNKEGLSINTLQKALESVEELLLKIVQCTVTYSDIIGNGALQLETINTEAEFSILRKFLVMDCEHSEGLEGVRCMLELFQFTHHIDKIHSVCHQYGLTKCLEDETLKSLMIIIQDLKSEKNRSSLKPLEAIEKMRVIKKALCLGEHTKYNCLDLFSAISDSPAFYQFIRDKQFMGNRGQNIFREQYQLITAQLQHEEYDENVLNHLRAAFEFIAPFMEQDISFKELMIKVIQLETTHGLKQLETVNENITLIRLWFSKLEGDTLENVAKELDDILSTGEYQFQLSNDQSNILLIYQSFQEARSNRRTASNTSLEEFEERLDSGPTYKLNTLPTVCPSLQPMMIGARQEERTFPVTKGSVERRWSSEQIGDFVMKLGFLDTKKEGNDKIEQFLHLNSTGNKLLELFTKLRELGHPRYQKHCDLPVLLCSKLAPDAEAMVNEIEHTLLQWTEKVSILRQKYCWLLFFSVPKLLHLYSLLDQDDNDLDFDAIMREITFLFENNLIVRKKLKPVVQKAIKMTQEKLQEDNTPIQLLGEFLQLICSFHDLQPFLLKQRSGQRRNTCNIVSHLATTPFSHTTLGSPQGTYQLHYAPGYTQSQLLRLITEIYEGVPESFEVFYCHPSTNEEELKIFMERVKHHSLLYLILEVNKLPQELLMKLLKHHKLSGESKNVSTVHFIETSPSVLRQVPWMKYWEHKEDGPDMTFDDAAIILKRKVLKPSDFSCIQLVFGHAGDGKTHYIRQQLAQSPAHLTIAVNEAFTPLNAINRLNTLPHNTSNCAVYFNFTLLMYHGVEQDKKESLYPQKLMETIGWFFFNFLVLGYVEDQSTGTSFHLPGGQEWAIYIEVPSLHHTYKPKESLDMFCEAISTLHLLGSPHVIHPDTPYAIDADVQLVCKYLRAYKIGGTKGIDRLYKQVPRDSNKKIKFSEDDDLTKEACNSLLLEFLPEHILRTKITQKLFIRYMKRRCEFLDSLPAFNYNIGVGEPIPGEARRKTDTRQLGSTLMKIMIEEVNNFVDPGIKRNWSEKPHQQLIYDFRDGGGSFGLLSLHLENLSEENKHNYKKIGFELYSGSEIEDRKILDQYLARALGLPLEKGKCLSAIDDSNYVLTLDYTIKMLNIHERYECSVPVIIKGETGVGKTALVEMLSCLWSHALLHLWNKERGIILTEIRDRIIVKAEESLHYYQTVLDIVESISSSQEVSVNDLKVLGQLSDSTTESGYFYSHLRTLLLNMATNPAVALLKFSDEGEATSSLDDFFQLVRTTNSPETVAGLFHAVLKAKIESTFHKLNIHAALTPSDIKKFFEPVFQQGKRIQTAFKNADETIKAKIKMPLVTVFLDEVNSSSCLGLFKEIIVDRTLDGESIPENIFIVAACNPHRGNSMAIHAEETWLHSSYYVKPLHPTLEYLMWDYGSLNQYQEGDYIRTKMQMLHKELSNIEVDMLAELIGVSQSLMRNCALKQLIKQGMKDETAKVSSHSCVSQRDIQRVFTFYQWLMSLYEEVKQHGERKDYSWRAVMVSLGIVYYMRLNSKCREEYKEVLNSQIRLPGQVKFSNAFQEELDWFCKNIHLPPGIAKTQALKENLFATIVCTATHTPLIIVGPPGSSKTLSFNLAIDNVKGPESKMPLFRKVDIFKGLDPHFYQCSRQTTSNEIQMIFSRAINRQRSHTKSLLPIYCVVFMDEAGLPEESHESLKVLHYHLDKQEVSFVAISNHVLDAAKTNRAVSLFRPGCSEEDLKTLAKGCWCSTPPPELENDLNTIEQFCQPYFSLMEREKLSKFFGLRDFIHFINYLRRRQTKGITPQLVIEGLERNFNGIYWTQPGRGESFQEICQSLLEKMKSSTDQPISLSDYYQRSILEILQDSLLDRPESGKEENEVRYKLLIDPSEDNSLVNLLITFGVLERKKTRIFVCSDFPGDGESQKINTIAAIRHSAVEGHTVVMSQTNNIHESFYDLFNQRLRRIHVDPGQDPHCYANIAIGAHSKPCRIHKDFVCIIVVQQSEIEDTPAPFLNRFEKYYISHETLLQTAMNHLQPCVRVILQTAKEKVKQFIDLVGGDKSLYGLKKETLDSLLLSLLPPYGHTYKEIPPGDLIGDNVKICLLQELLRVFNKSAGFAVPAYQLDELEADAEYLFSLIQNDAAFDGILPSLTIDSIHKAVFEAMHVLHTAPVPNESMVPKEMSEKAGLVIFILQHWLIHHLCKQLMQLMTPEAIILYHKEIPHLLIDNYLSHQQHFSLKKLINHHYAALESCQGDTFLCATKLLCFTRSSPIIHQLPAKYPSIIRRDEPQEDTEDTTLLKEVICEDLNLVKVFKVSSFKSQSVIHKVLRDFTRSPNQKILLILANMQQTTRNMINHLRIMIEETETQAMPIHHKLFVLLLHFPPAMFFDNCYPSLFLQGWSHYYLDSIGDCPTINPGTINIEEWFQRCCFSNIELSEDSLMRSCNHLLVDVIPVLASHVSYGTRSCGPFTRNMKATERCNKLKELLIDKGVGKILCKFFRNYWRPRVMVEHLERAATFTQSQNSSLNIKDAIQAMFQSTFTDFMVVMVARINNNRNLDVLFAPDCNPVIESLFLSLLETLPCPKLSQLKILAASLTQPQPQEYQPVFPFFSVICNGIEQLIEEALKVKGHQEDLLEERQGNEIQPISMSHDPESWMERHLLSTIEQDLEDNGRSQDPVYIFLRYLIDDSTDLVWNRYFSDFMYHSLHIDIVTSSLSRKVLQVFFSIFLELPPLKKIISLLAYVHYNKINLGYLSSLLRPLKRIQQVATEAPHTLSDGESSSLVSQFIKAIQESKHPFNNPQMLSEFVITALFSALVGAVFPQCEEDKKKDVQIEVLRIWYQTYLQVMSIPTLKSHLYGTPIPSTEEAMFNLIHSTFVMIHIHQTPNEDVLINGCKVFTTLLSKYFNPNLKLKENVNLPRLSECANMTIEIMEEPRKPSISLEMLRRLKEELFSHFFSHDRKTYSIEDQDWFLKLANTQYKWNASTQVKNEPVVDTRDHASASKTPQLIDNSSVSMAIYKMYLSRILGYHNQSADSDYQGLEVLLFYKDEGPSRHIGRLLSECKGDQTAGPYIPTFYQDCRAIQDCHQAENPLMQQPLCHLYFVTLMEYLLAKPRDVKPLILILGKISQSYHSDTVPLGNKIILHIEKQAILQSFLHELASLLGTNQPIVIKETLKPVMKELNDLLDDVSTGGGMIGGHGLTLGMHLLHELQSDRKFTDLFTTRYHPFNEINCLNVFHQQLKTQTESKTYLLPFMQTEDQNSQLYQQVRSAMLHIDETKGAQSAVNQLLKVAERCTSKLKMSKPLRTKDNIGRIQDFKMMIWLVTYYEFFLAKKISQPMCLVIGRELKDYIPNQSVARLIQSFLNPSWLIVEKEVSPQLKDAQTLLDGPVQQMDHEGEKVDPLYEMFMPPPSSPRDQSDDDLCHCLANLVGVILGCQPQSNHLWYHLFSPNELKNTYMTGFMFDSKIGPEGLLYDCGVELTAEGQYGQPDYHRHATRGTYSLHSLYLLLWANFGAFCFSLLTHPNSQSEIHGTIISKSQNIRHYCVSQVKRMWMYLKNNLSLSDEERSFFVTRCLMNIYEVNRDASAGIGGKFKTKEEQDEYEIMWHTRIYKPGLEGLHSKFAQNSALWQNEVFMKIRQLEVCYPRFPNETEFLNLIKGVDLEDDELRILLKFGIEKQRLEVGGRLLPDLIQLYQWLHTHLSHEVTVDRAYKLSIGQLCSQKDKKLQDLYNKSKEQYNQYIKLVGGVIGQGAVRMGNRIADDLPLIRYLSDLEEEGEGNDWLYAVIRDITETQNLFIQTLYASIGENKTNHPLARLLPSESTHVYPTEANEYSWIGGSDFLQLIRSRQEPYWVTGSLLNTSVKLARPFLSFNLKYLQEDIVSMYLAGRPIFEDVSCIRSVFKFRQESDTQPLNSIGAAFDLTSLKDLLPQTFTSPLDADLTRHLEYEFHSANYHTLTNIVIGLKTALGHLIKEQGSQVAKEMEDKTLQEFMLSQYKTKEKDSMLQIFCEVGIKNLSDTQLACLSSVRLCFLFSTLELFVRWVKEGLYDFNSLPIALKVHLNEEDSTLLEQLPDSFSSTSSQLLAELKRLIDALHHIEARLIKEVNKQAQKPLLGFLQSLCPVLGTDKLPGLIPNTVLVHHYVNFRLILRKITSELEQRVSMVAASQQIKEDNEQWTGYVDNLWSKVLPHLCVKGLVEYIDQNLLMTQYGLCNNLEDRSDSELGLEDSDLQEEM